MACSKTPHLWTFSIPSLLASLGRSNYLAAQTRPVLPELSLLRHSPVPPERWKWLPGPGTVRALDIVARTRPRLRQSARNSCSGLPLFCQSVKIHSKSIRGSSKTHPAHIHDTFKTQTRCIHETPKIHASFIQATFNLPICIQDTFRFHS